MQGYRRNCSACHSFCCPISHENCISVMLANSVNRSAHRHGYSLQHGPPILQLFHHSAGCSFPLLGHWMTSRNPCAYQFCLRHRWTGDTRSQAERNLSSLHQWVHGKELTYQPRLSFRICLAMLNSAWSVLHWAHTHSCSQHHSYSMFDSPYQLWSLLHQVTVTDWPMDWIVGQKQVSLDPRYPRTWSFHYSIWNALEHEVKRIVGG